MKHLRYWKRYYQFIGLALGLLFACKNPSDVVGQNPDQALTIEMRAYLKQSEGCVQDSVHCMKISATYPYLSGGSPAVRQSINDTILHHLKANLAVFAVDASDLKESLDQIADSYILEFEELMKESPDYPFAWEVSVESSIPYQSKKVLSIALNVYSFTGGAHPNTYLDLLNFDLTNGEKMELMDIFNNPEQLKIAVEKKFREVREISEDVSMTDAGFFWGDPFELPQNFALQEDGVYFYYNPYEAAAYALGATEFTIPYKDLKGLLREP